VQEQEKPNILIAQRHAALWSGVCILLLGAVLRLAAFDESIIRGDQSSILGAAIHIAHFRALPLVGIKSSVGVMQTAITPYLAAVPLLLVERAIAVQWFFAVLDLLALAWLHRAMRRAFGPRAALVAALLYASNPWVVRYIRTIWYQTLIPTFAAISFACLLWLLSQARGERPTYPAKHNGIMALALLSTALMAQVHLAALPWAGLLALLSLLLAQRYRLWRGFVLGAALSALSALPYLIFLLQTDFGDIRFMLAAGSGNSGGWNTAALRLTSELISGAMVLATGRGEYWERAVIEWRFAYAIMPICLLLAGVWAVWGVARDRSRRWLWGLMLGWTLLVPAFFLRSGVHLQHFYLLTIFPAPLALVGAWVEENLTQRRQDAKGKSVTQRRRGAEAQRRFDKNLTQGRKDARAQGFLCFSWRSLRLGVSHLNKALARVAVAMLLLLALWWSYLWIARIRLEARGLMSRPTRAWLLDHTAEVAADYLAQDSTAQLLILTEFDTHLSAFDWLRAYVNDDRVRVIRAGQGFVIPDAPTCYLLGPGASEENLSLVRQQATFRADMTIPAKPTWPVACIPAPGALPAPLASWQNGLSLLEAEIQGDFAAGSTLHITYTWRYQEVAPQEYHFFTHLLQNGSLVAQVDGEGVPSWYWRDGDVLITRFALLLPQDLLAGTYRLRVGAYGWPDLQRVLLRNGEDGYEVREWEE